MGTRVLAAALVLACAGCSKAPSERATAADAAPRPDAATPVAVTTVTLHADRVVVSGARGTAQVMPCDNGRSDLAAIVAAACAMTGAGGGIDLATSEGLPYGRLVELLEAFLALGLRSVAVTALPPRIETPLATPVAPRCAARPEWCEALDAPRAVDGASASTLIDVPHAATGGELVTILVVTVTTDAIFVGGRVVAKLADLAASPPDAPIAPLASALRERPGDEPIAIDADNRVSSALVVRVVDTCKGAGRTRIRLGGPPRPEPPQNPP